ncbi:hypothetical protein CUROG_06755 [Corynebacterium urogenitale]|uniref:Uncharacterized protein n=1 Tax=Corynebacterium urogenitale TaxID=2487892 RepID=A0A5J6ZB00_9CORY|nr:hypothetical protein [Corynebacterium urogenitale]QFQ02707.1 hypothetical protein CUROG_06755 [Corynebacterium urogenitale]
MHSGHLGGQWMFDWPAWRRKFGIPTNTIGTADIHEGRATESLQCR